VRVLLIGAVLGALLGGCSFVMLGSIPWLDLPRQLLISVVLGLSFSGLVWSFGLVRWLATRFDPRSQRETTRVSVPESTEPLGPYDEAYDSLDPSWESPDPLHAAEVHYDENTGAVDPAFIQAVDEPTPPPQVREELEGDVGTPRERGRADAHYPPFMDDDEDENATQLVSREELKALARAVLEGRAPSEAVEPLASHEVEELLFQADAAVLDGRFEEALDVFSQVIDGSADPRAYLGRGRVYLDHSDFNRAMSDFATAEELMPGAPEPLLAMGDLCFACKDYGQSIEYLTLALGQQPDDAMALMRRGMSQFYRKEYRLALDDLQRASQLDPDIPMLRSYLTRAERRVRGVSTTAPSDRRRR